MDGGGIKGIIPGLALADLERRTGRPAAQLFDLVDASASNLRHLRAKGEQLVSDSASVLDRLAGELVAGPG